MLVQKSTNGALGRMCWYSEVLYEHWGGSADTEEYYRTTGKAMLVQQSTMSSWEAVLVQWSTTGALVSLSLYSRVLQDYLAGCVGTVEYYKITAKAVLVQYNTWVAVLVQ